MDSISYCPICSSNNSRRLWTASTSDQASHFLSPLENSKKYELLKKHIKYGILNLLELNILKIKKLINTLDQKNFSTQGIGKSVAAGAAAYTDQVGSQTFDKFNVKLSDGTSFSSNQKNRCFCLFFCSHPFSILWVSNEFIISNTLSIPVFSRLEQVKTGGVQLFFELGNKCKAL